MAFKGECIVMHAPAPSADVGATYRNVLAKDGFPPAPEGCETLYAMFETSVKRYPDRKCLGYRPVRGEGAWALAAERWDRPVGGGIWADEAMGVWRP